jgi:hypothetical protein
MTPVKFSRKINNNEPISIIGNRVNLTAMLKKLLLIAKFSIIAKNIQRMMAI